MKPEEINATIAESCGWRRAHLATQDKNDKEKRGWLPPNVGGDGWHVRWNPPNYCGDLNEMAEAEKFLYGEQIETYGRLLMLATDAEVLYAAGYEADIDVVDIVKVARASAVQRSFAFLRAIGKLEASPCAT